MGVPDGRVLNHKVGKYIQLEQTMKNDLRSDYLTRDSILKVLSDEEVASVSTAETADRLMDGDEYLDLEQLRQGVQKALQTTIPMGRVLPRKAVHANTWNKIVAQLVEPGSKTEHIST